MKDGNWNFKVSSTATFGKTAIITGYRGSEIDLIIPETVGNDLPVLSIGEEVFEGNESIETVMIPDKVTNIREAAFARCRNLKKITIPASVTVIEDYAFTGCYSLTEVKLPDTLEYLGTGCFYKCPLDDSFSIPKHIKRIGQLAFPEGMNYQDNSVTIEENKEAVTDEAADFQDEENDVPKL
jgi:hypothetical protein